MHKSLINETVLDDSIEISNQQLQSETSKESPISIQITQFQSQSEPMLHELQYKNANSKSCEHERIRLQIDMDDLKPEISAGYDSEEERNVNLMGLKSKSLGFICD
eukprot:878810_1